jgi:hypothetical protein
MILGRSVTDFVSSLRGKLDVIKLPGMTENRAVKAAVIFELSEHNEPEALRIRLGDRSQVIGRSGYSHRRAELHGNARFRAKTSPENLKPLVAFRKR